MKFTPLKGLWLLVAIQCFLLVLLLGTHFCIQSLNTRLVDQRGQILAHLTDARQKIQDEPNPEKIRSEALALLDLTDQGNQTVLVMETNLQKMNDAVGLVFFLITAYLGVCVYKLNRR